MIPPPGGRKRGETLHQPLLSNSPPRSGVAVPMGMHVRAQARAPQRLRVSSPAPTKLLVPSRLAGGGLQQAAATRQRDK